MMIERSPRAFSLTELLVVVAVILILVSILLVGTGAVYTQATRVQCQHRLEQLGQACQMFANANHGRPLRSYDREAYRRWYDALFADGYIDNRAVLACPSSGGFATGESAEVETTSESTLPLLLYNCGTGRCQSEWTEWGTYVTLRAWFNENFEYGFLCPQGDGDTLVPLTLPMLSASSQAWFLNTEYYEVPAPILKAPETDAIKTFHLNGGGIHCWSESYRQDDYYRSTNEILKACGDVGIVADTLVLSGGGATWVMPQSDHPVMYEDGYHVTKMASAYSPAKFIIKDGEQHATVLGTHYNEYEDDPTYHQWVNLIVAWDDGNARVLLHGSYTSLLSYGGWPSYDIEEYCRNSEKWLRRSGGLRSSGRCTYGYNNQVGLDGGAPGGDTIVIMDYIDWEIDRDKIEPAKNDDDSYIAPRHGGKANCLLADGRVQALYIKECTSGRWTPQPGD